MQFSILRNFEKLRVVNFQNNPVQSDAEYAPVLLAFLKHLKYLDFRLVDEHMVSVAMAIQAVSRGAAGVISQGAILFGFAANATRRARKRQAKEGSTRKDRERSTACGGP